MSEGLEATLLSMMDKGFREVRETMAADSAKAAASRSAVYNKLEELGRQQDDLGRRMEAMEEFKASSSPTLAEVRAAKNKAEGAGLLGKGLWKIGGILLTIAVLLYNWRHDIAEAFTKIMR